MTGYDGPTGWGSPIGAELIKYDPELPVDAGPPDTGPVDSGQPLTVDSGQPSPGIDGSAFADGGSNSKQVNPDTADTATAGCSCTVLGGSSSGGGVAAFLAMGVVAAAASRRRRQS